MKVDKDFNLLSKLHVEYGKRWKGKRYFFVGASVNYFLLEQEAVIKNYHIKSAVITSGKLFDLNNFEGRQPQSRNHNRKQNKF